MTNKINAWHFLRDNWKTNEGGILERVGSRLVHEGELRVGHSGLHASHRVIDALTYAAGNVITLVECEAPFVEHVGDDKFVATARTPVWGYDASKELLVFARTTALDALTQFWDAKRFGEMPAVVFEWLRTGDTSLKSAARSAARSAAESAAWSAARSAAKSAAESAAWSAARSAQNKTLEKLITDGAIERALIKIGGDK